MSKPKKEKIVSQPAAVQVKQAWLIGASRDIGGDNADYDGRVPDGENEKITVRIGRVVFSTYVLINGALARKFTSDNGYNRCVQPAEALSLMGYEVHGTIDFAECVPAVEL